MSRIIIFNFMKQNSACKNQNYHLPVRHRALDSVELKRHGLGNIDKKNQYVISQKCG